MSASCKIETEILIRSISEESLVALDRRQSKILTGIDFKNKKGLEFGPLASPILSKSLANVQYVDFASQEFLRAKYLDDPNVNVDAIGKVDVVLGGNSILDFVEPDSCDFIIASHVLEHVPNVVGWLQEIQILLKPEGQIGLALPDMRFTFDHLRNVAKTSDIAAAYYKKTRTPSPEQIFDHLLYYSSIDVDEAWRRLLANEVHPRVFDNSLHLASFAVIDAINNGTYHDVHCWVFSDLDFCKLMLWMCEEDLITFGCQTFFPTHLGEFEFFLTLVKTDKSHAISTWSEKIKELEINHIPLSLQSTSSISTTLYSDQLSDILSSKSWRYTFFLRKVYSRFRKMLHI
jgi:SAM-dependent methyltransferase